MSQWSVYKDKANREERQVLIVSSRQELAERLQRGLEQRLPRRIKFRISAEAGPDPEGILPDLLILSATTKKDILPSLPRLRQGTSREVWEGKADLCPGMHLKEIARKVEDKLANLAPGGADFRPLVLYYSFDPRKRKAWLYRSLKERKPDAHSQFYVPFLPRYQISFPLHLSAGPELATLLLLISSGGEAKAEGLGLCFEAQRDGYYALRVGGGSEDLTAAPLSTQEELFWLFRTYLRKRSARATMHVECGEIPFSKLRVLAGLCDYCLCEFPKGNSYAQVAARKEVEELIASLPDSCRYLDPDRLIQEGRKFP